MGASASRVFRIAGYLFAGMAAVLVLLVWGSRWAPLQRFDVTGALFLIQNAGYFFALVLAAIFLSAAIGCWVMAIRARWM